MSQTTAPAAPSRANAPPAQSQYFDESLFLRGSLPRKEDAVRFALSAVRGVPKAQYIARNGRVFVYDKLVELVRKNPALAGRPPVLNADGVRALIQDAWLAPQEAATLWRICPWPYQIQCVGGDQRRWQIQHAFLNARVAMPDCSKAYASATAARMLAGESVGSPAHEPGYFEFRGQHLILCDPIDPASLPPRPRYSLDETPVEAGEPVVSKVEWSDGFAPLPREKFDRVRTLEMRWLKDNTRARRRAQARTAEIWRAADGLPFATLNGFDGPVSPEDARLLDGLRDHYPELAVLGDKALCEHYWTYQINTVWDDDGIVARREDGFLFHLLGALVNRVDPYALDGGLGEVIGAFLLDGWTFDEARIQLDAWLHYDRALSQLAWNVLLAMRFLTDDHNQDGQRAPLLLNATAAAISRLVYGARNDKPTHD